MQAIYHANLNEITFSFFEKLKKQYSDVMVDIVINDSNKKNNMTYSKKKHNYIDFLIKNPVSVPKNFQFLSRDEANQR